MSTVASYRTNFQQLQQFKDVFLTNSKNMSSLGKYVSFGGLSTQLNVSFSWSDSFNKQRVISKAPLIDQYSSMYNFAVCLARMGCYMDLTGDGIK